MKLPPEHDHDTWTSNAKILGEAFDVRMQRFGEIVEGMDTADGEMRERSLAACRTANSVLLEQQRLIRSLYDAIVHGDDSHRAWLRKSIDEHFGRFI